MSEKQWTRSSRQKVIFGCEPGGPRAKGCMTENSDSVGKVPSMVKADISQTNSADPTHGKCDNSDSNSQSMNFSTAENNNRKRTDECEKSSPEPYQITNQTQSLEPDESIGGEEEQSLAPESLFSFSDSQNCSVETKELEHVIQEQPCLSSSEGEEIPLLVPELCSEETSLLDCADFSQSSSDLIGTTAVDYKCSVRLIVTFTMAAIMSQIKAKQRPSCSHSKTLLSFFTNIKFNSTKYQASTDRSGRTRNHYTRSSKAHRKHHRKKIEQQNPSGHRWRWTRALTAGRRLRTSSDRGGMNTRGPKARFKTLKTFPDKDTSSPRGKECKEYNVCCFV